MPRKAQTTPTKQTYEGLDQAYAYFNKRLFDGKLPDCLITVRKHGKARGFFHGEVFESTDGDEIRDEIALNMQYFKDRTPAQTLSTLVHEMVDLEQHHRGTPIRSGYHNKEWAALMDRVGLTPTDTGEPGGKRTGQRVTHMIVDRGPFDLAFKARTFVIPYHDRQRDPEAAQKKLKAMGRGIYGELVRLQKTDLAPEVRIRVRAVLAEIDSSLAFPQQREKP